MPQQIVTQRLLADIALEFNLGCDLFAKSNRVIEKYLGAEKLSGDTVQVPITGGGRTFNTMDLSSFKGTTALKTDRSSVPVRVGPHATAAELTQEEITLFMEHPEALSKRVAQLADEAQTYLYKVLVSGSQAYVAKSTAEQDVRTVFFDAEAGTQASKIDGDLIAVTHPTTWNRLVATLQGTFGPNPTIGQSLYKNELGPWAGLKWSKATSQPNILAADNKTVTGEITITSGQAYSGLGAGDIAGFASPKEGDITLPFTIDGVFNCDGLGNNTGELKTFTLVYHDADVMGDGTVAGWYFSVPPCWERGKGRQNCFIEGVSDGDVLPEDGVDDYTGTAAAVLTAGVRYFAPAVMYREKDLLVAVKGVASFYGCDSMTIPTSYREKGILPLRGTAWTDAYAAVSLFRVDVLYGANVYNGLSIASVWIPVADPVTADDDDGGDDTQNAGGGDAQNGGETPAAGGDNAGGGTNP